jgi:hypothetical protein
MTSHQALIAYDTYLKESAPACVRQVMVLRAESNPGFVVSFEVLFSKGVPYEDVAKDPRRAAEDLWTEFQCAMRDAWEGFET